MNRIINFSFFLVFIATFCAGCKPDGQAEYRPAFSEMPIRPVETMVFGVHPLHNPHKLFQVYQPLIEHLNRQLPGIRLRLEASRDYRAFERKLADRHFQFALPNPYQTMRSLGQGYRVFAKMADDENFRGIILVRKDSPMKRPVDLRGKTISYPAPTALAGAILPQWFLHQSGLDVRHDLVNTYVGSQESSIMSVYLGTADAGATWPPPWRAFVKEHPEIAAKLEVRWETRSLVNNGLVVREDVSESVTERLTAALLSLNETAEGRTILDRLELSRFETADASTYVPIKQFLERFEQDIGPIEGR